MYTNHFATKSNYYGAIRPGVFLSSSSPLSKNLCIVDKLKGERGGGGGANMLERDRDREGG